MNYDCLPLSNCWSLVSYHFELWREISRHGIYASLTQTVLRYLSDGVSFPKVDRRRQSVVGELNFHCYYYKEDIRVII